VLSDLADLLLPAVCPGCQRAEGPLLCLDCTKSLPAIEFPCSWCGEPREAPGAPCPACDGRGLPHIAAVTVRWYYDGLLADLVGDAKAGERPAAGRALAAVMPSLIGLIGPGDDGAAVVPVPPSGNRPGRHLGTQLARQVAADADLPFRAILRTTRAAAAQHGLHQADRERNVAGLFAVRGPAPPVAVLVDDLVTSGATASAAAAALRAAGSRRVVLVCLARTAKRWRPAIATSDGTD
jgi:predicted amidophosphoribosyltransferase